MAPGVLDAGGRLLSAVGEAGRDGEDSGPPPPKGKLRFEADFEAGNLGVVRAITENEYELTLRSDTNSQRFRLWFYFRVRNCKVGQRALIHVTNFSKTTSLYRDGMSPLVRSNTRPRWQRLPPKSTFYYRSPKHKNQYVLSFMFVFDREDDEYFFAYSYPYTYTDQQRFLSEVMRNDLPYVERTLLCRSVQQRRVDVLTIGEPPSPGRRKRVVVVSARVHPGETPASHCTHGLIEFAVSDAPEAQQLRKECTLVVVPMLNPDGVFIGNYRTCSLGSDLNRMWESPTDTMEPTLAATKRLLKKYDSDPDVDLDMFIDVHAHSTCRTGFFLCNPTNDPIDNQRIATLPKLLASLSRDFSVGACRFDTDPSKEGSARRACAKDLGSRTMCYTLEVSFFANFGTGDATIGSQYASSEEDYRDLGRNFGLALLEFYRTGGREGSPACSSPATVAENGALARGGPQRLTDGNGSPRIVQPAPPSLVLDTGHGGPQPATSPRLYAALPPTVPVRAATAAATRTVYMRRDLLPPPQPIRVSTRASTADGRVQSGRASASPFSSQAGSARRSEAVKALASSISGAMEARAAGFGVARRHAGRSAFER